MEDNLCISPLSLSNMVDKVMGSGVSLANTVFMEMNMYNIWYAAVV